MVCSNYDLASSSINLFVQHYAYIDMRIIYYKTRI